MSNGHIHLIIQVPILSAEIGDHSFIYIDLISENGDIHEHFNDLHEKKKEKLYGKKII